MARTGRPRGRTPKPDGEKYIKKMLTFPPKLWARVESEISEGERATFVQQAVEEKLGPETKEGAD